MEVAVVSSYLNSCSFSSSAHHHHHHLLSLSSLSCSPRKIRTHNNNNFNFNFVAISPPQRLLLSGRRLFRRSSSISGLSNSSSSSSSSSTPIIVGTSQVVNENDPDTLTNTSKDKDKDMTMATMMLPKVDKSGRFCSPRAARELALMILYAACLDGSDPVRLFEKRLNARRETGYEFDKASLMEYNHMTFGGPPVTTHTTEEADEMLRIDQKESDLEAEVLSAPPKLVYSKLILRFTRKLLVAVVDKWDCNVLAIDKVAPPNWKNEPASRILEFSVLHLAMSEIAVLGTRHQIVINEAVDLAKRFCDGAAPRVINGCLRTFVKDLNQTGETQNLKIKQTV